MGLSVVERVETTKAFVAATVTVDPASTPVNENRTASAASTVLSDGTEILAGVVDDVADVIATPFTVNETVATACALVAPKSESSNPDTTTIEATVFFLLCI
jgi:hypothetical protein